jgi:hypothetical protein
LTVGIVPRLDVYGETNRTTVEHESYGACRGIQLCRPVQRRLESGRAVCGQMVILLP